ncbi:MAG: hypothetical protein E7195_09005 [Peptococcaceae bacterium]|nr:hypothetical protein [Peptococcaceae bacterium]
MKRKMIILLIACLAFCMIPFSAFASMDSAFENDEILTETPEGVPIVLVEEYTSIDENGFVVTTRVYETDGNPNSRVLIDKYMTVQKTYFKSSPYPETYLYDKIVDGIHWVGTLEIISTSITERELVDVVYGGYVYANLG